jgi:RNA polymerase sigma-70 factor (ECF subfamily)
MIVQSFISGTVVDVHDSEDILQEVAKSAYVDFDKFDPGRSFNTWVMQIARRRVVDYFRSRPHEQVGFDPEALDSLSLAFEKLADENELRGRALSHCLQKVHARGREALDLRYQHRVPVRQIAARMGVTTNAISVLLYNVRSSLADCIERQLKHEGVDQ